MPRLLWTRVKRRTGKTKDCADKHPVRTYSWCHGTLLLAWLKLRGDLVCLVACFFPLNSQLQLSALSLKYIKCVRVGGNGYGVLLKSPARHCPQPRVSPESAPSQPKGSGIRQKAWVPQIHLGVFFKISHCWRQTLAPSAFRFGGQSVASADDAKTGTYRRRCLEAEVVEGVLPQSVKLSPCPIAAPAFASKHTFSILPTLHVLSLS